MNSSKKQWLLIVTVVVFLFMIEPMYAGPGGAIAKGLFKTWWGKLLLIGLTIILLPLIIYIRLVEYRKEQEIKKILAQISLKHKDFNWIQLQREFSNIIRRVYNAWTNEDLSEVKNYVNHWYWQNQQMTFLDQWKKENLINVSSLKEIKRIRPLYLSLSTASDLEGSKIAIAIDVVAEDYLKDRTTNKIKQGKEGYDVLEYVWFLEFTEGKWLLDAIEEGGMSLQIAKTPNVIPEQYGAIV